MSRIEEIQKEIAKLEAEKERLEKPPRWRAKPGECYYSFYYGVANKRVEGEDVGTDNSYYLNLNYFKKKSECESFGAYLKARYIIEKDAGGYKFDKDLGNYYGIYDVESNEVIWSYDTDYYIQGKIYFESEESITESQIKHPKEWLTYVTYGLPEEASNE